LQSVTAAAAKKKAFKFDKESHFESAQHCSSFKPVYILVRASFFKGSFERPGVPLSCTWGETEQNSREDTHQAQQHGCSTSLPKASYEENPEDKRIVKALLPTSPRNHSLVAPACGTLSH